MCKKDPYSLSFYDRLQHNSFIYANCLSIDFLQLKGRKRSIIPKQIVVAEYFNKCITEQKHFFFFKRCYIVLFYFSQTVFPKFLTISEVDVIKVVMIIIL